MIVAEPTSADVAELRDELASALRAVERTPDELLGRPDLFRVADKLTVELKALAEAAQPSLPRKAQP